MCKKPEVLTYDWTKMGGRSGLSELARTSFFDKYRGFIRSTGCIIVIRLRSKSPCSNRGPFEFGWSQHS